MKVNLKMVFGTDMGFLNLIISKYIMEIGWKMKSKVKGKLETVQLSTKKNHYPRIQMDYLP